MPCSIQLECNGNVENVNITLKWAQIREEFLEETAFEPSLKDFDPVALEGHSI